MEIRAAHFADLYFQLSKALMISDTEDDIRGRIVLKHVFAHCSFPGFIRAGETKMDLEKKLCLCVPIDIPKKVRYIKEHYYRGLLEKFEAEKESIRFAETKMFWQPTKEDPSIAYMGVSRSGKPRSSGNELTVVFRSSRLFPVLFLDLLAITEIASQLKIVEVNFFFDTLFLQRETVLLDLIFPDLERGELFKRSVKIWKNQISRPDADIKFGQTKKLKKFYNSIEKEF